MVRKICAALNKPESLIQFVEDRKGHDLRYAVDFSKIRFELNWEPLTDFSRGLQDTIHWYSDYHGWWETTLTEAYQEIPRELSV